MATIQSSLQLYDGMSPVLRKITNAMNIAISSFEDMSKASSQPFDTARLHDARKQLNEAEAECIPQQYPGPGHLFQAGASTACYLVDS